MSCIVSIVGRPNVGKSTLFNRIVGRRKAIVHVKSGVTRDRIYGESEWNGVHFYIVDTGGYTYNMDKKDILHQEIKKQILIAVKEADVVLFLVDIQIGLIDTDIEISQILRKCQKKYIILVVNKVDNGKYMYSDTDFFRLGFDNYYCISSINGSGTGELLDRVIEIIVKEKKKPKIEKKEMIPRFSIIGRPNVGKSTLINSFLDKNHHIVTNISGTTIDSLDVFYKKLGYKCILVDTPGVRKKSKISENIEFYSTMRTVKTIEYTDICFLMVDAFRGWESQDRHIFKLVEKYQKGIIILINKWDLFSNKNQLMKKNFEIFIRKNIAPFDNVPILFISAKEKYGLSNIIPIAYQIFDIRKKKLKTKILNRVMLPIIKKNPPTSIKKKCITIKYCTQLPTYTPKFIFFSNFPQYIKESYKRFIEKKIRYFFDFKGVPIQIFFRKKK
ncbi:ribosome biogenesis GTPase Der [Blattabacterium cuenoti]|uniref:ribosome biogenesis GTPase Der n=1 Tax=Blattabacterium cuenoti TaxID=1653831 RepID=UPI00163D30FB|nr:ribosome biogenesis GTPase Der [Blattabacterium cuenoti]